MFEYYSCAVSGCAYKTLAKREIVKHCGDHLNFENSVLCPISKCKKAIKNKSTLRSHLYRKHGPNLRRNVRAEENCVVDNIATHCELETSDNKNQPINNNKFIEKEENGLNQKRNFDLLFQHLYSKYRISDEALQFLVNNISQIFESHDSFILRGLKSFCEEHNILALENNILHFMQRNSLVLQFLEFRSKYSRKKHFTKEFAYVAPKQICLGINNFHENCFFHYVPILDSLKSLMQDRNYHKIFHEDKPFQKNVLLDYNDGSVYKSSEYFTNGEKKIEILLFQDSFELCNPLGSSKKKHKLLGIYMSVGNINHKFRSIINNIQLVILCKEHFVKTFGFDEILKPLISDISLLEQHGIEVRSPFNDSLKKYYGSLFSVLGDNLGSHQIGGFHENFNSVEYVCRYCFFKTSQLHNFDTKIAELRTVQTYKINLEQKYLSGKTSEKGVKFDSSLNNLQHFHVNNPGLPPCIAHDLFEGIIPYDLMDIVKHFCHSGVISIDYINCSLSSLKKLFKLSFSFPTIDLKSKKLPGKAYEIWNLLILMPLILLNKVNHDDNAWQFLMSMVEACRIVCAAEIHINQTILLSHYINLYFEYRKACFPSSSLRPKHHYFSHYPDLLRKLGPLKHLWTMSFEQKHQYFKACCRQARNFKNVTKMLSEKHQVMQASLFESRFNSKIECERVEKLTSDMFNVAWPSEFVFVTKKILYLNTVYKASDYVVVSCNNQAEIDVLIINAIFVNHSYEKAIFYGVILKMWYNENSLLFESFNLEKSYCLIELTSIIVKKPVNILKQKNTFYFSPLSTFCTEL